MQEGISYISASQVPCVIADVMRMGPGIGTGGQQGQTDYRQVTKGGGHGAYRCIVLAPASAQEVFNLNFLQERMIAEYPLGEFKNVGEVA
jgi:pyruvate/2-oxoacid:ferredoxin oxidoreductase alpha subunit